MRAATPVVEGHVPRAGARIGYQVFGAGDQTVLLLPTWTIVHSRFWKMQVAYLARHFRVITFDGPGNGRSDEVTDPARFSPEEYADDAVAVLDECNADEVVAVGLSLGSAYGSMLATRHPERVQGLVMIGASIPVTPPSPERMAVAEMFTEPAPANPRGWEKYNLDYWDRDYQDFTEFFFSQCFVEPHSTKPIEDCVDWARSAGPAVLRASAQAPMPAPDEWQQILRSIDCPLLVIHGTEDRISPFERAVLICELAGGQLITIDGGGHIPVARDPVIVNLALKDFVEEVAR